MIEFGQTLRAAREAKGLTTRQVADKTHMMVQMVENLEKEDFSKIVAPIYGRGFVKLYCEAVDIDPKPLIAEFMDIYNGNRPPTIRMREPVPAPAPQPEPEPVPQMSAPEEADPPAPEAPLPPTETFQLEPERVTQTISRYAAPLPLEEPQDSFNFSIPPAVWRILALAIGAAVILWLLYAGVSALYRATMSEPQETEEPQYVEPPREPMTLPPLYID